MITGRKKLTVILFAGVLLGVLCSYFVYYSYGLYLEKLHVEARQQMPYEEVAGLVTARDTIVYQGKKYERDPSVKAFLLLGIDSVGELERKVTGGGGQADAVFLIAYDAAKGGIQVLMIPRDTMTPITLTDLSGNILGKDIQHITLAYGYGDGRELSCERMSEAVSELLNGLQIDGYLAMNTSMIGELNDLAGGVTVTVETSDLEGRDPELTKGKTVTLNGEQAETFVRYRDIEIDHSALARMDRQSQYVEGYVAAIQKKAVRDDQTIVKLMSYIENNMITNLNKDQYLNIGKAVVYGQEPFGQDNIRTLPGEGIVGRFFDEFHHDPEVTTEIVLELFYREV